MGQSFTGGQLRCAIRRVASHTRACTGTRASMVQNGVCEPRETHHCLAKQLRGSGDECDDDDGDWKGRASDAERRTRRRSR